MKKKTLTIILITSLALTIGLVLILKKSANQITQTPRFTKAPSKSSYLFQSAGPNHKAFLGDRKQRNQPEIKFEQEEAWITFSLEKEAETMAENDQKILYRNVWPGIDITYQPIENGLKEEIVVSNLAALSSLFKNQDASFNFTAQLNQASLESSSLSGNIVFVDPENGDYRFHFEKPFMIDANGQKSEDVILRLVPQENDSQDSEKTTTYSVQIIPSWQWLSDPDRTYPITIDPTIIYNQGAAYWPGDKNRTANEKLLAYLGYHGIKNQEFLLDAHTVGLWHMDGNWQDSSEINNHGTANNGATFTNSAKVGPQAGDFTGTSDYVVTTSDITLAMEKEFTLEAWVWPRTLSTDATWGNSIIQKDLNSRGYQLTWHQDGKFGCLLGNGSGATIDFGIPYKSAMRWYHAACVYDGTNIKVYVDGVLENSTPRSYERNVEDYVWFGAWYGGRNFDGYIDEVRISNIARTAEEIKYNARRSPYGTYTSGVIDLGEHAVGFDGLSWDKLAVKTGDGEEPFSTNGLVAQWNFNETSGTSLADSSGNNKTGTLVNFANTSGQDVNPGSGWTSNNKRWGAGALMFDGTNDYVNIGGTGAFNSLTIPFSVDGWIYLRDGNPSWAPIFATDDPDTDTGNYYGFYFRVGPSKQLDITFGNGVSAGGDGRRSYGGGPEILLGQWTHVAATVNGPEEMKLYVNGIEVSGVYSGSATTMAHNNAYTARIGRMIRYGPFYMNGAVDSLRVYSRILPASEIVSNYQAGTIEFQTRTGATSSPNDGSWEEWKPTSGETQLLSLDSDASNWSWNSTANMAPLSKTDVDDIKTEGSGSMGLIFGSRYSSANTVGLWKMEETSGTGAYIKDSGNSGADLTPSGTTVVNGFFGKARRFNGTSDYLSCSDANCGGTDKLDVTGSLTIEAWIYPESPTGTRRIVSKWSSSSSGTYFLTYSESTNYTPRFLVRGATQAYRDASVSVPIKTWTHVAGVYDAGAQTLDVYVNGRLSNGSLSGTVPSSLANSNDDFYIGAERSGTNLFSGKIDEVRIMSTALTAATIEQSYRAAMGHYLGRTISSTNLSDKTKLSFDIASDRTGTFLETIIGESDFANNQADGNTAGLWHFEERSDSGVWKPLKDQSGNDNHASISGTSPVSGKIRLGRYFNGSSDYAYIADAASMRVSSYTVSAWIYADQQSETWKGIVGKPGRNYNMWLGDANTDAAYVHHKFASTGGGTNDGCPNTAKVVRWGQWNHIVITNDGSTCKTYVNGKEEASGSVNGSLVVYNDTTYIGRNLDGSAANYFKGIIDEVRIDNLARSADQVRQLYEIEKRTHPIHIDFASSPNGADVKGTSEANAKNDTTLVLADDDMINNISPSETVIVKENYNGTDYVLQGTVASVDTGTRTITVSSWTGTVPSAGTTICGGSDTHCFSAHASVFKWQKEWFDLSGPLSSHLDSVTKISLRLTNGWEGRSVWLDDFRANQSYLDDNTGSAISSTINRYFQYRAIFSTTDRGVSPLLAGISLDYDILEAPSNCTVDDSQHPNQLVVKWQDNSSIETGYQVVRIRQEDSDEETFNLSAGTESYTDTGVEADYSYQYRVRTEKDGVYSAWCHTSVLDLDTGNFRFEGLKMEGITLD